MSECNKCGACCKNISLFNYVWERIQKQTKDDYFENCDIQFVKENWELVEQREDYVIVKCKMLSEDNLCKVYKNKPLTCSQFPFYNKKTLEDFYEYGVILLSDDCAFMKEKEIGRMIHILKTTFKICDMKIKKEEVLEAASK